MFQETVKRLEDLNVRVKINSSFQRERLKSDVVRCKGPRFDRERLTHKFRIEGRHSFHVPPDDLVIRHVTPPTRNTACVEFWELVIAEPDIMNPTGNAFGRWHR